MRPEAAFLVLTLLACPVQAETAPEAAMTDLRAAGEDLQAALSKRERRDALGAALRAYESALAVMEDAAASAGAQSRALDRKVTEEARSIERLLGAAARLGLAGTPHVLSGASPDDAIRAGLLIGGATRGVTTRVGTLRQDRARLAKNLEARQTALDRLREAHSTLAVARDALISSAETSAPLPDPSRDATLLAELAAALDGESPADLPSAARQDYLPPVLGPFAPAPNRPGVTITAPPGASVLSPTTATLRFTGDIDGYGPVAILEPGPGQFLILAGLDTVLPPPGTTLPRGALLGFLPFHEEFSSADGDPGGKSATETLYIELRQDGAPVSLDGWFPAAHE